MGRQKKTFLALKRFGPFLFLHPHGAWSPKAEIGPARSHARASQMALISRRLPIAVDADRTVENLIRTVNKIPPPPASPETLFHSLPPLSLSSVAAAARRLRERARERRRRRPPLAGARVQLWPARDFVERCSSVPFAASGSRAHGGSRDPTGGGLVATAATSPVVGRR